MFRIDFTPDAIEDMKIHRKYDRERVVAEIEYQLAHQPDIRTRNRKRLRPNSLAEWELRIDPFRVFYDVDRDRGSVSIVAVGKKEGNRLIIRGMEFQL